jgi:hypothetical protein
MAHRESAFSEIGLDQRREFQETETVGDAASIPSDALSEFLLSPTILGDQSLIRLGLLHRVQVFTEQILDQRHLEALGIGGFSDDRRNLREASELGRSPPALADDQLVALPHTADDDGLKHACLTKRRGEAA